MKSTISLSLLAIVYWLRDEDGTRLSKFLMESALEYPCVYHAHPILGRRLHLAGDTAAEKDFDMAI